MAAGGSGLNSAGGAPAKTVIGDVVQAPFAYASVPRLTRFDDVLDAARYQRVPDDWLIGLCDVVGSTKAIAEGRYRQVNFAGAAAIAAVRNALPGVDLPFVFGGDGASLIVSPAQAAAVARALAATVTFVKEELKLDLRAALIPVSAVRAAGHDLRVARYAASTHVDYAMFSGGGLAWADAAMKRGLHAIPPAPSGTRPNLTGLSCRFEAVPAVDGLVLSIIAVARPGADSAAVSRALREILAVIEASPSMGRPLPVGGPPVRAPWAGLDAEAGAAGPLAGSRALRRLALLIQRTITFLIFVLDVPLGRFSPRRYGYRLAANADFRKYDDGLRLTVSCPAPVADRIEARLRAARDAGLLRYGLHRQGAAVVTCISPAPTREDHIHFVDGAQGGYAEAARALKQAP